MTGAQQALAGALTLAALAGVGYVGQGDYEAATAQQDRQCRMVGHHLADQRAGVPPIDRRGWPEPSPGWYEANCEQED